MVSRTINRDGVLLLLLTLCSFGLGERGGHGLLPWTVILGLALIKGRWIIDRFMALGPVGGVFRWLLLGWLCATLALIAYAFVGTLPSA